MATETGETTEIKNEANESKLDLDNPEIKAALQAAIDEQLKTIKENLDKSYKARDAALAEAAAAKQAARDAEIARLKEEGKHAEALQKELEDAKREADLLKQKNISLTRDLMLRGALAEHPFRNTRALESAYRDLVNEFIQDESGKWLSRSGKTIEAVVTEYVGDPENAFLLKPKVSSGAGNDNKPTTTTTKTSGSLFGKPLTDVLKMAEEGTLPTQRMRK